MTTMDDRHNCDQLKARADRLRDRQVKRGMWTDDDEGTWKAISKTGSLNIWDDAFGFTWNEVINQCDAWDTELTHVTELPLKTSTVYYLTIVLTTGTDLDIALDALKCSDLGGMTLETIQLEVLR